MSAIILALLRLSVNPIETLLNCKRGWNIQHLFPGLRYSAPIEHGAYSQTTMCDTVTKRNASTGLYDTNFQVTDNIKLS